MNASELFEHLQLLDENERIEAKAASKIGKSVMETICAFANEPGLGGGWLLLGVAPDTDAPIPGYKVQGIDAPDKLSADLASQAASTFNQPLRLDIHTDILNNKPVLLVFVPEAEASNKPVYFKAQGLPRGAYRRIGSTDQRGTEDDLVALYQGRQQESFDAGLATDATLDDQTYREINKVDTLTASQTLKRLRDNGLLIQKGRGSATWYQPAGRMLSDDGPDSLGNPDPLSSNPKPLSSNLESLSSNLRAESTEPEQQKRSDLLNELPGELAARVGAIGQRHPPQAIRDVVVALCHQRPWRTEELALLLQRNTETVRQNYLRPLLHAGRIHMTRPDKPNDPEQAYRGSDPI